MQRAAYIGAGLLIGLVQITLRGLGGEVVIPNLALVLIVYLSSRLDLPSLGAVAIACGVVLELASASSAGMHILGLVLLVLVAKLLLRSAEEESQPWFLLVLMLTGTVAYSLALIFSLSFSQVQSHWGVIVSQVLIECLYNSILFGFCMAIGARRAQGQKKYRLPT